MWAAYANGMGSAAYSALFDTGRNAWRIAHASRTAPLVDAKEYFEAIVWAAERAERSIFFLCWDIDSRITLLPDAPPNGDYWSEPGSRSLGDFLYHLLEARPQLQIYILCWDFLFIYANERESKREALKNFRRHPRMHFYFDKTGPALVSHHQKLVVVDDQLAFCGGLDITQRRWDTPEHRVHRELRTDPTGQRYEPFHDVQLLVQGPVARELGLVCRERWWRRTGQEIELNGNPPNLALWPVFLPPLVENVPVAVARTVPASNGVQEVKENLALFEDSIRAARDYIYIENQYLTSRRIGDLLVERLEEENPPEIVILLRQHDSKWTEAISMSLLRTRLVKRLREHDRKNRLLVLCPVASTSQEVCINLHSKVFIADDSLVRIGSSNLCGRSEGMDTECDLAFTVGEAERKRAVRKFRDRLLAEHLGISLAEAEAALAVNGSMLQLLRDFQGKRDKTLAPCTENSRPLLELLAPSRSIVDPENPSQLNRAIRRLFGGIFLLAALVAAILLFPEIPYRESLAGGARWVQQQPLAPLGLTALFALLTLLGCPLLPLAVAFALLLPPLETFTYAMVGALMSSSLVFLFSRSRLRLARGAGFFSRLAQSERLETMQDALKRGGFWPVLLLRLVPVAPFWIMNFCLGVLGVKFRHYFMATFLGLLPGFVLIAWFEDKAREQGGAKWLALALIVFAAVTWGLQKEVGKHLER